MSYTLPPARSPFSFVRILQWTACIVLAALLYWVLQPRPVKEVVNWRPSLEAAQVEALRTNKLIFADFTATWCEPCQELRRELWSDKSVAKALESFVPIQIDVDQKQKIAMGFQIEAMPTFLLIRPDGQVVKRTEGAMGRSEFLNWLDRRKR